MKHIIERLDEYMSDPAGDGLLDYAFISFSLAFAVYLLFVLLPALLS
jgi:hypothetical protein